MRGGSGDAGRRIERSGNVFVVSSVGLEMSARLIKYLTLVLLSGAASACSVGPIVPPVLFIVAEEPRTICNGHQSADEAALYRDVDDQFVGDYVSQKSWSDPLHVEGLRQRVRLGACILHVRVVDVDDDDDDEYLVLFGDVGDKSNIFVVLDGARLHVALWDVVPARYGAPDLVIEQGPGATRFGFPSLVADSGTGATTTFSRYYASENGRLRMIAESVPARP